MADRRDAISNILDTVTSGGHAATAARLVALRGWMQREGIDLLIVPHDDAYLSEYLPDAAQRLAWLTGFTGSAGMALIGLDRATLFVDSRYTLQARIQTDPALFDTIESAVRDPSDELLAAVPAGARVAFDPWLHTATFAARLRADGIAKGGTVTTLAANPVDVQWQDRPAPPAGALWPHPEAFAGESSLDKRERLAAWLRERNLDEVLLAAPLSVAWLLNIRGDDTPCTPTPLCRALLARDGTARLFTNPARPGLDSLPRALGSGITIEVEARLPEMLRTSSDRRIGYDPDSTPEALVAALAGAQALPVIDPCILPRAVKNPVEIAGARAAHLRDGLAMVRFLSGLAGALEAIDEIDAATRVEQLRTDVGMRKVSFDTISAAGPHAAIGHYRATPATAARLHAYPLYLLDSGGQYDDGTTDVTRTVAMQSPTPTLRDRFTRVLKGHIALASLRFPHGVSGHRLDAVARLALWNAGLDYAHNTGHGVGAFLNVHEGPQGITRTPNEQPLLPGMILSNEPGYYRDGEYGIRIENLMVVTNAAPIPDGDLPMLEFETLTLVPIDRRLIEVAMLTATERRWVDDYHARVAVALMPLCDVIEACWLTDATRAL